MDSETELSVASASRQKSIAVIPARGGSKRIPRKNVRLMSGKPLISWTIESALASQAFTEVIVSTEDDEILSIATQAGALAPFQRPGALADDVTPTVPVIAHAAAEMRRLGRDFDYVCCLYPAAIFISPAEIAESGRMLAETPGANYVATVARFPAPVQEAMELDDAGRIAFVEPENYGTSTHGFADRYFDAGQVYWGRAEAWLAGTPIFTKALGYVLPSWRAQDIDTPDDWERAQMMHQVLLGDARS